MGVRETEARARVAVVLAGVGLGLLVGTDPTAAPARWVPPAAVVVATLVVAVTRWARTRDRAERLEGTLRALVLDDASAVAVLDPAGVPTTTNPAWDALVGPATALDGIVPLDPDRVGPITAVRDTGVAAHDVLVVLPGAVGRLGLLDLRPVVAADGTWLVARLRDVTEELRVIEALAVHADRDPLTSVGNRRSLAGAADELDGRTAEVVVVDLDRFKPVNDEHGHHVGDEVLVDVAARLQAVAGIRDLVVRLGGDEFAVVAEAGSRPGSLLEEVRAVLAEPFATSAGVVDLRCSAGAAIGDGAGLPELLRAADRAMYDQKRSGYDRDRSGRDGVPA